MKLAQACQCLPDSAGPGPRILELKYHRVKPEPQLVTDFQISELGVTVTLSYYPGMIVASNF